MTVVVCSMGSACAAVDNANREVPEAMLGFWRTDDINYRGRFIEIRSASIWIGTGPGPGNRTRYTILDVQQTRDSIGLLYTIRYRDVEGDDHQISFYFDESGIGRMGQQFYAYDGTHGTIRLKNQIQVEWRKTRH